MQFATSRLFRSFELYLEKNNNKKLFKNYFGKSKVLQIMIPEGRVGPQWRLKFLHKEIYGEKKTIWPEKLFLAQNHFQVGQFKFCSNHDPQGFQLGHNGGGVKFLHTNIQRKIFQHFARKAVTCVETSSSSADNQACSNRDPWGKGRAAMRG